MPSSAAIATFVAACALLALTPGPNMSLIVANTLSGGLRAGLVTLAGALTGLTVLVIIAAFGMTSVMVFMSDWFEVIRWVGALYLIILGVRQFMSYWRSRGSAPVPQKPRQSGTLYLHGLAVALSNPKVLLFLGAFLPQFVDPASAPGPQLATFAILFVATLLVVDLGYTLAVARARAAFDMRKLRVLDGLAGALLVAGGLVLATARRP
ncbi:MAG TPA: LysE family translocator [Hyphomicrobiaceae bacterium]|nr:LysE family translocator [Hyphomicrobiaceae bacterium]